MPAKIRTEYGEISFSEELIADIAGLATIECYGLVGMANKSAKDGFAELLKKENLRKGVKVTIDSNEEVVIDLYIIVEFGTRISVIADNIISKVKYSVETHTGLTVKMVNVNVQGVRV